MELDVFISKTLQDIIKGVNSAQDFAVQNGSIINPVIATHDKNGLGLHMVEFDIALTITTEQNSDIGGKIAIAGFGIGSNLIDKGLNETISRVKFKIPLVFRQSKT